MAGIGFRLQALVNTGSYINVTKSYLSSAIITAGPWLSGVIAVSLLQSASTSFLSSGQRNLLFATLTSVFAASLIASSSISLVLTRYLADRLYDSDEAAIAPTCVGVLVSICPLTVLTLPFLVWGPLDIRYRLLVASLFVILTMVWLIMIFLSAAREYTRLVIIYMVCQLGSLIAAIGLEGGQGVTGCLAGYAIGQALCLALLVMSVFQEFGPLSPASFRYLQYFCTFWELSGIGISYTLGSWVDNIWLWYAPQGQVIVGFYHVFPPYDVAKFLGYLTTIPAATFFLVHLETNFHHHYQRFYALIQAQSPLDAILKAKKGMLEAAQSGLVSLIKIQAIVLAIVCLGTHEITGRMGLDHVSDTIVRIVAIGASGQFLMLNAILLLLYLDQRRDALFLTLLFFMGNTVITPLLQVFGSGWYGMGYLISGFIAAGWGWFLVNHRLKHLDSITFLSQPVIDE